MLMFTFTQSKRIIYDFRLTLTRINDYVFLKRKKIIKNKKYRCVCMQVHRYQIEKKNYVFELNKKTFLINILKTSLQ